MIDWTGPAKLFVRDDLGSERDYDFHECDTGTVHVLVTKVMAMSTQARARLVMDAGAQGMFGVGEIIALAAAPDFPG